MGNLKIFVCIELSYYAGKWKFHIVEMYAELCQRSKIELFAEVANGIQPLIKAPSQFFTEFWTRLCMVLANIK